VAHADGRNGNALGTGRDSIEAEGIPLADACRAGLPLFAPGPGAFDAWREILAHEPSLEPAICRVVDGLAPGMVGDRLRLTGNGVVPLAAAYAFVSLCAALLDV